MRLGGRIRSKREELGLSIRALASKVGISDVSLGRIEKTDAEKSKYAPELAKALNVSLAWLLEGQGSPNVPSPNLIPLIDESYARYFTNVDALPADEIQQWVASPEDMNGLGFAITVRGDSMVSDNGGGYPDGSIAVFTNEVEGLKSGDLVLVCIDDADDSITFKKYIKDAGDSFLAPLNNLYAPLHIESTILGVFKFAIVF